MYQVTTPTFTFTLSIDTANITSLLLTFRQKGRNILNLTEDDVTMTGNNVDVSLTQEQTKLFSVGKAFAQFRVKLTDDTVESSNPVGITISETYNTEILQ